MRCYCAALTLSPRRSDDTFTMQLEASFRVALSVARVKGDSQACMHNPGRCSTRYCLSCGIPLTRRQSGGVKARRRRPMTRGGARAEPGHAPAPRKAQRGLLCDGSVCLLFLFLLVVAVVVLFFHFLLLLLVLLQTYEQETLNKR